MSEKSLFLSPEWIERVRTLRKEHASESPSLEAKITMNLIVTELPFEQDELRAYVRTTEGFVDLELGELSDAEVTVTIDYATTKAIFVDGNPQAAIEAFMAGKIRVTGDMTKLLSLQALMTPSDGGDILGGIKAITLE
ncbi:MAG: SCP2 sterol-binding domain-containing protein [Acidimicrobiales bacterium]|jgi:putative sterol carrier protein